MTTLTNENKIYLLSKSIDLLGLCMKIIIENEVSFIEKKYDRFRVDLMIQKIMNLSDLKKKWDKKNKPTPENINAWKIFNFCNTKYVYDFEDFESTRKKINEFTNYATNINFLISFLKNELKDIEKNDSLNKQKFFKIKEIEEFWQEALFLATIDENVMKFFKIDDFLQNVLRILLDKPNLSVNFKNLINNEEPTKLFMKRTSNLSKYSIDLFDLIYIIRLISEITEDILYSLFIIDIRNINLRNINTMNDFLKHHPFGNIRLSTKENILVETNIKNKNSKLDMNHIVEKLQDYYKDEKNMEFYDIHIKQISYLYPNFSNNSIFNMIKNSKYSNTTTCIVDKAFLNHIIDYINMCLNFVLEKSQNDENFLPFVRYINYIDLSYLNNSLDFSLKKTYFMVNKVKKLVNQNKIRTERTMQEFFGKDQTKFQLESKDILSKASDDSEEYGLSFNNRSNDFEVDKALNSILKNLNKDNNIPIKDEKKTINLDYKKYFTFKKEMQKKILSNEDFLTINGFIKKIDSLSVYDITLAFGLIYCKYDDNFGFDDFDICYIDISKSYNHISQNSFKFEIFLKDKAIDFTPMKRLNVKKDLFVQAYKNFISVLQPHLKNKKSILANT